MLSFFFGLFLPPRFRKYRYLHEDRTESEHFEIRGLVRGDVDAVFIDKVRGVTLLDAGRHLWKLDRYGNIVDTFAPHGKMYSSGLCLNDDGYYDWVLTGDKTRKKFGPVIDANALSDEELYARFSSADIVEFDRRHTPALDWPGAAYLWTKDGMTVMDISRHGDRIDTRCDRSGYSEGPFEKIRWHDTGFEGYQKKYACPLVFHGTHYLSDWKADADKTAEDRPVFSKETFVRDFYYLEDGILGQIFFRFTLGPLLKLAGLPGALPTSYWYGIGYYRLQYRGESLGFKAYTQNRGGVIPSEHIFYRPTPDCPEGLMFIERLRTWDRYSNKGKKVAQICQQEQGLFRLRRKTDRPPMAIPAAPDNVITDGQRSTYRTRNSWQPAYAGMMVETGLWGDIQFYDGVEGSHHYMLHPDAFPTGLHAIPQSMTFHWQDRKQESAFKLYLGDGRHAWYPNHEHSPDIALTFRFDESEIVEAFRRLDARGHPIELEVHFEEIFEVGATLSLRLRSGKMSIELKRTAIDCLVPVFGDDPELAAYFDRSRLKVEYSRLLDDAALWPDYLALADEILVRSPHTRECIPLMMQNAAKLLLNYTSAYASDGSHAREVETVFDYFADRLLPHIGRPDDTDDVKGNWASITSNTLAFAIIAKHERLGADIFEKVLGRDFDVTTLTNGTLAYNVACYHALRREKSLFLKAARQALMLGKKVEQLSGEPDFAGYRDDPDFLGLLAAASAGATSGTKA